MAYSGENIKKQLIEITECPICMCAFTDPRMLSCIHTFCFQCLKSTSEAAEKKPGDKMPCPLCRKEFIIPADGMNGVQKNFFMENLLEFQTTMQMGSAIIICDMCNFRNGGKSGQIPTATLRCLECQDNYCESCAKVHQFQKLSRSHQVVKIGSDTESEMNRLSSVKSCTKHTHKPLDYYCADCKRIICVSCLVESHKLHDCKDVTTVDEEFRQTIEEKASKTSNYADELLAMRKNTEKRKADFLKNMVEKENAVHNRNQELKQMIDEHTDILLDELSVIKARHLKEMEIEMEEIDINCTILNSFGTYCTELRSKGSPSDICCAADELLARAYDLEKDHEALIGRPRKSVEVFFEKTDLKETYQMANGNAVGQIKAKTETSTHSEKCLILVGLNDCTAITKDVIRVNLHRPNEIRREDQIPTTMKVEAFAAIYSNTMYVTGIGINNDNIWKYNLASGWVKCASLVQGRRRHSAAFIDEVFYICGGFVDSNNRSLHSVEAYSAINKKCATVGRLVHCVQASGNCVPIKSSLYIFGGIDKANEAFNHVQVYNTKQNSCTLLSKPMPGGYYLMRAALSETSVILLGRYTCFIFNFETQNWQDREQFKTDVSHFGLVLDNERVFVIGGGIWEKDKVGKKKWTCRDDVRYVPLQNILDNRPIEWKIHGKLPKPSLVQCCVDMRFLV